MIAFNVCIIYRLPVKVLHVNTGAPAEHFMRQMITAVYAPKSILEFTARSVSALLPCNLFCFFFTRQYYNATTTILTIYTIERFHLRNQRSHLFIKTKERKRVHFPQDWLAPPIWLIFYCFAPKIWPTWRDVKMIYTMTTVLALQC